MTLDWEVTLAEKSRAIEKKLDRLLPKIEGPESLLANAMRYATLGERIRPNGFLVCASAELFSVDPVRTLRVAAAVECAFTCSTIHDDLPCMDDIGDRWEKPAVHTRFGEATAILAGDALSALAFELLASESTHEDPSIRCQLIAGLSGAVGGHGAVGGQIHELLPAGSDADIGEITRLQQMKSGALLAYSSAAGGILGHATRVSRHALRAFAHDLGLAWQIMNDVRAEGDRGGKKLDRRASFATVLGSERASIQAKILAHQATEHLDLFDKNTEYLISLVDFVLALDH